MLSGGAFRILSKSIKLRSFEVIGALLTGRRDLRILFGARGPGQPAYNCHSRVVDDGKAPRQPAGISHDRAIAKNAAKMIASVSQYKAGLLVVESSGAISIS
jgi:hypothetical protein